MPKGTTVEGAVTWLPSRRILVLLLLRCSQLYGLRESYENEYQIYYDYICGQKQNAGKRRQNCIIRTRVRESHTTCTAERTGSTCHLQGMPQIGIVPVLLGPQRYVYLIPEGTLQTLNSRETGFAVEIDGRSKPHVRGNMYLREGTIKEVFYLA